MQEDLTFVYVTREVSDAEELKRRLAEVGINATVVCREISEPDEQGQTVRIVVAGVAVAEADGEAARRVVLDFDSAGLLPMHGQPGAAREDEVGQHPLELEVVYVARTGDQAHLLKSALGERGIQAIVLNQDLASRAGVGATLWGVLPRVAVARDDAMLARTIALRFEEQTRPRPDNHEAEEEEPTDATTEAPLSQWPRCPECDARRITRCPVCGTAGSDFPSADTDFPEMLAANDAPGPAASCCGPGGCAPGASPAGTDTTADAEDDPEPPGTMLTCSTCDEPFVPRYARLCEWCGHEFDDGYETPLPDTPVEEIGSRVIAVIVGLLALVVALVFYFMFIV
jgi:hypothetical protein